VFLSPFVPSTRLRFPFEAAFGPIEADDPAVLPTRLPRVEVTNAADEHTVVAEVPGVPSDGVKLSAEKGVLSLVATAPKWVWKRSFTLPDDVDVDSIKASLKDGLLTITLPRVQAARPRQIRVEGA